MANLILGLGGTGAKLVESFVHLCATGLGPESAAVAFIDQDRSNGNTTRARTALGKYSSARKALVDARGESALDCDLLRTKLDPHAPSEVDGDGAVEACHWVPQRKQDVKLADLIHYDLMERESSKDLARALFHEGEELRMQLNEGYRGRPHVGSAALLTQLESDPFWASLEQLVRNDASGEGVRVFLCGSAFGGTGAAILPTLARRLRDVASEEGRTLRTGAVLMLPYFSFAPAEDAEENVATSSELLLQSQAALEYYHNETEVHGKPYSFDDIYLVGWEPLVGMNYHAAGAMTQVNPPLAPELYGALAAARFFQEERQDVGQRTDLHIIARKDRGELGWGDLPSVNKEGKSVATAYAAWLRFCALWHFNYKVALGDAAEAPPGARDEAWYRAMLGAAGPDPKRKEAVDEYVERALMYAAAMSAFSTGEPHRMSFDLWTHGPIAEVDKGSPTSEPVLEKGSLRSALSRFEALVHGFDDAPNAADIYWSLCEKPPPVSDARGLWSFVAHLYDCVVPPPRA